MAVMAGILAAQNVERHAPPRKSEPYVEPDYEVVWARRWRVIRPVLLVLLVAAVVFFTWASSRGNPS